MLQKLRSANLQSQLVENPTKLSGKSEDFSTESDFSQQSISFSQNTLENSRDIGLDPKVMNSLMLCARDFESAVQRKAFNALCLRMPTTCRVGFWNGPGEFMLGLTAGLDHRDDSRLRLLGALHFARTLIVKDPSLAEVISNLPIEHNSKALKSLVENFYRNHYLKTDPQQGLQSLFSKISNQSASIAEISLANGILVGLREVSSQGLQRAYSGDLRSCLKRLCKGNRESPINDDSFPSTNNGLVAQPKSTLLPLEQIIGYLSGKMKSWKVKLSHPVASRTTSGNEINRAQPRNENDFFTAKELPKYFKDCNQLNLDNIFLSAKLKKSLEFNSLSKVSLRLEPILNSYSNKELLKSDNNKFPNW